jgi:Domain of unknown function (DUF1929)/Divergent InlB B-repeat domain/Kelch motif
MRGLPPAFRLAAALTTATLIASACQDNRSFEPELARVKPDRTLTVTGAGTGSGKVTAPQVLEVQPMVCGISEGVANTTNCAKTYPWKSIVTLTAAADPGSSFAGWSGACTGTGATCRLTMTQARNVQARFSGAGLPSYTLSIAGSGTGGGTVSTPVGFSPAISCTISAGSAVSGSCNATYTSGTQVPLSVTPTSGHTFTGWSGACSGTGGCSVTLSGDRTATASFEAPAGPEASTGRWDAPAAMDAVAIHLSQLPNGRVLFWGHIEEPFTLNPTGGGAIRVPNATCGGNCELFCSGHTYIANGSLLVAGGHDETQGDGFGLTQSSTFDGSSWQASGRMATGRWYPTLVTLADGSVVALSGSSSPGVIAQAPERWNNGAWTTLTGAGQFSMALFPRAFLEPKNGWIYLAEEHSMYLNPSGAGQWITSGVGTRVRNDRDYGAAVMLDTKVLAIGGGGGSTGTNCAPPENTAEIIDLAAASPTWSLVASMNFRRRQFNATILPDGTVLATGGTGACGFSTESGGVFAAEIYNPTANSWTVLSNASNKRVYHSTDALMADGRVLVTGSGEPGTTQKNYEVFSPPYLFKGARPTYTLGLPIRFNRPYVVYNQPFVVQTPNAASIRKVTLIRLTSTTHAFDMGQRLNTLSFTAATDGASLTVTPPASGKLAPPGPYHLFIVNDRGVPSVAETIILGTP